MTDYIILIGLLLLIIYWEKICGVVKSLANGIQKAIRNRKRMDPKVKKMLLVVGISLLVAVGIVTLFIIYADEEFKCLGFFPAIIVAPVVGLLINEMLD